MTKKTELEDAFANGYYIGSKKKKYQSDQVKSDFEEWYKERWTKIMGVDEAIERLHTERKGR